MLFLSWFDRRQVNLLTSVHSDTLFAKQVRCKDPANNSLRLVHKPMGIELYTKYMGGVDMLDRPSNPQLGQMVEEIVHVFVGGDLLPIQSPLADVTSSTTAVHKQTSMQTSHWSYQWLFQQCSKGISQASTQVEQKLESRQDKIALCAPADMCQEEDIRQSSSASSVRNQCTAPPASNGTTP